MTITLTRRERDGLREGLIDRLQSAADSLDPALIRGDFDEAAELNRTMRAFGLILDDLGWSAEADRQTFELTAPVEEVRAALRDVRAHQQDELAYGSRDLRDQVRFPTEDKQLVRDLLDEQLDVLGACNSVLEKVEVHHG
jgi:hypothetical protein